MNRRLKWIRALAFVSAALLPLWPGCKPQEVDTGKIPVTTSSDDAKKEYLLGRDCAERLQIQQANSHFQAAIAKDSNFALAYLAATELAPSSQGYLENLKKAVALADKVSKGERWLILVADAGLHNKPAKQKELYDSLVASYPRDERVQGGLGNFYYGRNEYANALEHFKKATEIDSTYAPAYNLMGYSYKELGKYADAENAFKKYIQLVPKDPNPYDSYGELLLRMGRFDESIAQYGRALALDSMFMSSHNGIAADLLYSGKKEESHARLQKLHDIARDEGELRDAMLAMTIHYVDCGKTDLALQEIDKRFAVAQKANDPVRMANDLGVKGNILFEAGRYDEAMATFDKEAKLIEGSSYPQSVKDYFALNHHIETALVSMKKKDFKTAAAECAAVQKGEESMGPPALQRAAHVIAGRLAFEKKEYDKALAELHQGDPASAYNLYLISLAYMGKGDKADAKEFCTKAAHSYAVQNLSYAFIRGKAEKMLLSL